ncbi:uncharacterized protein LOC124443478 isoform X2 [Xenia sp. Carnegie-2017]|uniref:uncharacterized protein LOC124443478 isoform X2 n=1 Tax=Xenia sp. Carnegie-2017 TaxID=2897299 RepID=UPI001F05052B|nr:uncharacterized protein LOC124443478 isoform X2 [Xenia sp. Carnegie-2017]
MAHGAWIFTTIKIILITCHRSSAEIGNLLDKDVKTSFKPHNEKWSLLDSRYYVCNSEDWLKSKKVLNTTGIKELYIKVVYVYRNNTSKSLLNNSAFHLGALDASIKTPVNFSMVNGKWINESYISTTPLLINSKALRIWIAPEKNFGGSCMFVSSVEITYKYCKQKERLSFAKLPQTFAPPHGAAAIRVQGHCIYSSHKAVAFCSSAGYWLNATFPCDCAPGKVMISDRCTVPSFVSELQVVRLSNTEARLSWKKRFPRNIIYNIVCYQCFGKYCNKNCPPGVNVIDNTMDKSSKIATLLKA